MRFCCGIVVVINPARNIYIGTAISRRVLGLAALFTPTEVMAYLCCCQTTPRDPDDDGDAHDIGDDDDGETNDSSIPTTSKLSCVTVGCAKLRRFPVTGSMLCLCLNCVGMRIRKGRKGFGKNSRRYALIMLCEEHARRKKVH